MAEREHTCMYHRLDLVEAKKQRYGVILKVQLSRKLQSFSLATFLEYYVLLFHKINGVHLVKKIFIMC